MIKFESKETSDKYLSKDSELCVPLTIDIFSSGHEITTYKNFYEKNKKIIDDIDRLENIENIDENIAIQINKFANDFNMSLYSKTGDVLLYFSIDSISDLTEIIPHEVNKISSNNEIKKYTQKFLDIYELNAVEYANITSNYAYVKIIENEIVSIATINDIPIENGVEICIETIPKHEGKGYATSCAYSLVRDLLNSGIKVFFVCDKENEKSISIAHKLGLKLEKKSINFVCYKN